MTPLLVPRSLGSCIPSFGRLLSVYFHHGRHDCQVAYAARTTKALANSLPPLLLRLLVMWSDPVRGWDLHHCDPAPLTAPPNFRVAVKCLERLQHRFVRARTNPAAKVGSSERAERRFFNSLI